MAYIINVISETAQFLTVPKGYEFAPALVKAIDQIFTP